MAIDSIPVFFIVGLPRSGTTLLEQMLNQHSKIAVCPEMATGQVLWRLNASQNITDRWQQLIILNYLYQRVSFFKTPMTECISHMAEKDFDFPIPTHLWFHQLIREFIQHKQADMYAEKTPENLLFLNELKNAFPGSKFIVLVRHPIDVVYSIIENLKLLPELNNFKGDECGQIIPMIKRYLNEIMLHKNRNEENFLFLKYEDLIMDPLQVLKGVCNFLSLDFETSLLDYRYKKGFSEKGENMKKIHHFLNEEINPSRVNRSFGFMNSKELYFLNEVFKGEMKYLGYSFAPVTDLPSGLIKTHIVLFKIKYFLKIDLFSTIIKKIRFILQYNGLKYVKVQFIQNRLSRSFFFK